MGAQLVACAPKKAPPPMPSFGIGFTNSQLPPAPLAPAPTLEIGTGPPQGKRLPEGNGRRVG